MLELIDIKIKKKIVMRPISNEIKNAVLEKAKNGAKSPKFLKLVSDLWPELLKIINNLTQIIIFPIKVADLKK